MGRRPLVTVLVAVHDGERFLRPALESVLRQSVRDLELLVVDDASTDATPELLDAIDDERARVLRNDVRAGLARSLNRGLDEARGDYVARLDADDVALPDRLEAQLRHLASAPNCAVVGSSVLELDRDSRPGRVHPMPRGADAVRFAALFGSPFFHPTVLVDRRVLEARGLRYDEGYAESEDYDLWSRLLDGAEGDNLERPLVLYRVHAGQASQRRRELQRDLQLRVARRALSALAPALADDEVELAWRVGANELSPEDHVREAADAYLAVVRAFEERHRSVPRERAGRDLARLVRRSPGEGRVARAALALDPLLPLREPLRRHSRASAERTAQAEAGSWLRTLSGAAPLRVTCVFPEPTPYRAPLLDRIAALPEIDLTVVYAAGTVARRTWTVEPRHRAVFLRGLRVPAAETLLHHEYPITPGVAGALRASRPDAVVVSGWSTFASQTAIAWCRLRGIPYLLVVESHDAWPKPGWRRAVKGAVVPLVVAGAAEVLVTGTLARESVLAHGAAPERVRVFANTVDVEEFGERADALAARRDELRARLGAEPGDVVVLSVARLAPEKRADLLLRAGAQAGDSSLLLVVAGDGPERGALERLARELEVRARFTGDVEWDRIVELYAAADVFALLSDREPWAVVVNEAAACGLPLVLSERVGAAHDLLRDGENGALVPAGDVAAAAAALRELAADEERRRALGARSREIAREWGYAPSVEGFVAAVREAVAGAGGRE